MSDIFQEVEEDLRRERLKGIWDRFGIYVILAAVLIVVGTAGWRGYEAWQTSTARANGDALSAALTAAQQSPDATSAAELAGFADGAPTGYAMVARFRAATDFARAGDTDQAVALFTQLSTDSSVPALYRDMASVRLAQTLLDTGDLDGAEQAVAVLAEDSSNAFTHAAQEVMGLAAYGKSDRVGAERWFSALESGAGVPQDMVQRARVMLALLAQSRTSDAPASPAEPATGGGEADPEETN